MWLKSPDDSVHWSGALQRCHCLGMLNEIPGEGKKWVSFPSSFVNKKDKEMVWGARWVVTKKSADKREGLKGVAPHWGIYCQEEKKGWCKTRSICPHLETAEASPHFNGPHYLPQNLSHGILTPPRHLCMCLWVCKAAQMIYYFLESYKIFAQFLNQSELAWLQDSVPTENSNDLHWKAFNKGIWNSVIDRSEKQGLCAWFSDGGLF